MDTALHETPPESPRGAAPLTPSATPPRSDYVLWFSDGGRADVPRAGGKGANLCEMTRAGLPVPPGFVLTVSAYERFLEANELRPWIATQLAKLDVDDAEGLRQAARAIQRAVRRSPMPDEVRSAALAAYAELGREGERGGASVAVRSSGTSEDAAETSFAGMFASSLNVHGERALLAAVRDCWASAFSERILFYRIRNELRNEVLVAVVVQRMVNSDRSGVVFTADPATSDRARIVIEGAWGLGEVVVLGQVTPDHWVVDKATLEIVERVAGHKPFMLTRDAGGETVRVPLDAERAAAFVLRDDEVRAVAELARRDEEHYGAPQDAEWAVEGGTFYMVQTRPITTLAPAPAGAPGGAPGGTPGAAAAPAPAAAQPGEAPRVLVRGLGAGPGLASGRVRVLASPDQADALEKGEVLVATMTSPDWVPLMRRASAIVTDAGGMTSHAAIVSRELGIPCIVGTRDATRLLATGTMVTVDARAGTVVAGALLAPPAPAAAAPGASPAAAVGAEPRVVTATKVYVNLGEPDLAESVARRDVDGVGLLRAEFMLLAALGGTHPRVLLRDGRGDELVDRMAAALETFAAAFHPRPVIYRATDFRSNEFRGLAGGEEFEPREENPMIGYRGCFRYTKEPELFALELAALARVRTRFPGLHLMIPFVRTGSEFRECRRLVDASGLTADGRMELWVMAEVPSVVTWLAEYARMGATGVSIGSNDLTQLVLGVDRDSDVLAPIYDERDPAVLATIRAIVTECRRLGITCSICGQAPSVHAGYAEQLVRWGVDSISVNPDVIERTRLHVAAAERRIMLEAARRPTEG